MSRAELDTIQSQLRLAIKSHQLLVAKMKSDPQNVSVQQQLHDLQNTITVLSDRQKNIVQQLRKELIPIQPRQDKSGRIQAILPRPVTASVTQAAIITPAQATLVVSNPVVSGNQQILMGGGQQVLLSNQVGSSAQVLMSNTASQNIITSNATGLTVGANPAAMGICTNPAGLSVSQPLLVASSGLQQVVVAHAALAAAQNKSAQPLQDTSGRLATASQQLQQQHQLDKSLVSSHLPVSAVIPGQNIIKQRMLLQSGALRAAAPGVAIVRPVVSQSVPRPPKSTIINRAATTAQGQRAASPLKVPHFQSKPQQGGHKPAILSRAQPSTAKVNVPTVHRQSLHERKSAPERKPLISEEKKKSTYMAALDLVSQDALKEMQNKRSERKRRSTANPQFAYGHFEEKRRAFNYLSPTMTSGAKRPKGRPRINSRNNSPLPTENQNMKNGVTNNQCISSDCCVICHKTGELLMCDACMSVYHMPCVNVTVIPSATWVCPKCQSLGKQPSNWPGTFALVTSYIAHKTAKEEEKQKLERMGKDLHEERGQLELKSKELNQHINKQLQQKLKLNMQNRSAQQDVDKLKHFMNVFQS